MATTATRAASTATFFASKAATPSTLPTTPTGLTKPLVRQPDGKFAEVPAGNKPSPTPEPNCAKLRESRGGNTAIGVIGSNRTTNEENYLLQKFARTVLGTNNIDHHRTADYSAFARAIAGQKDRAAGRCANP